MELKYSIGEQDFIDYNLYFVAHDAATQKAISRLRWQLAILVLICGAALMYFLKSLTAVSMAVYLALAVFAFCYAPKYFCNRVKKNVRITIKNAANKHICGEKTMILGETALTLTGEDEDSSYTYDAIQTVIEAQKQVYIMLDDISSLIVPNSAFTDEKAKKNFISVLRQKIDTARDE